VAITDTNPSLRQSRDNARDHATSGPVARPRLALPKRDPARGKHWIGGHDKQVTVDQVYANLGLSRPDRATSRAAS
jgi:hypothetical protein